MICEQCSTAENIAGVQYFELQLLKELQVRESAAAAVLGTADQGPGNGEQRPDCGKVGQPLGSVLTARGVGELAQTAGRVYCERGSP